MKELDDAELRFIVGSRQVKVPHDLATYFHWNGEWAEDQTVIDTIRAAFGEGASLRRLDAAGEHGQI